MRIRRLRPALPLLAKAAELRRDLPRYAYVYAVPLREAGEPRRALDVLKAAHERAPAGRDILIALAQYSRAARAARDQKGPGGWARKLVELAPDHTRAREFLRGLEDER